MHQARLPADEYTVVDGIPATTVPRTIFDLAAAGDRRSAERALHEAEVQHLTDRLSIPHLLECYPRHAGAPMLHEILAIGAENGSTANDFEALFAALIEQHGLPWPRFNVDLFLDGRHFRPDCMWEEQRVVVELDSRRVHGTDKAFEADRERDRIFVANGWRIVRVTWRQLTINPEALVGDLHRVLGTTPAFPGI
jgi:very-short-patch-repair endonuclease